MGLQRILTGISHRYGDRTPFLLAILIFLAAISAWMQWYNKPAVTPVATTSPGPDYYLKNFTITATGTDGTPRYLIKSSYMEYMSGQETVTFLQPQLLFHNENRSSWTVTGEQARVTGQGKQVMMKGKVVLEQRSESSDKALRIETADLLVLPGLKRAETVAEVVMKTDYSTINAIGFRVDLTQDKLNFLHQTRGRYYVSPPS